MGDVIGLVPVPGDKPLGEFIESLIVRDTVLMDEKVQELHDTIKETLESDQPEEFAYAKMLNYLAKGVPHPDLISVCAAALWHIAELDGEIGA